MKLLFIGFLISLTKTYSFCQNNKINISLFYQPNISGVVADFSEQKLNPCYGYLIGLNFDYFITSKFYLTTGIAFISKASESSYKIQFYKAIGDSVYKSNIGEVSAINQNHYLRVPVAIGLNILKRNKVTLSIFSGFGIDFYLYSNYKRELKENGTKRVLSKNSIVNDFYAQLVTVFGCGFNYKVYKKISILFQPVFDISIYSVPKKVYFQEWNMGMQIGVRYLIAN